MRRRNSLRWALLTKFDDPFDFQFDLRVDGVTDQVLRRIVDLYMAPPTHPVTQPTKWQLSRRLRWFNSLLFDLRAALGLDLLALFLDLFGDVFRKLDAAFHPLPQRVVMRKARWSAFEWVIETADQHRVLG